MLVWRSQRDVCSHAAFKYPLPAPILKCTAMCITEICKQFDQNGPLVTYMVLAIIGFVNLRFLCQPKSYASFADFFLLLILELAPVSPVLQHARSTSVYLVIKIIVVATVMSLILVQRYCVQSVNSIKTCMTHYVSIFCKITPMTWFQILYSRVIRAQLFSK